MMTILKKMPATLLKSLFNAISAGSFTYYTVLCNYIKLINIDPDSCLGIAGQVRPAFSLAMAQHKSHTSSIN